MTRAVTANVPSPATGIVLNLPPNAIPPTAWLDALNVRYKNGRTQTSPGWVKFTSQQLDGSIKLLDQYFKFDNTDFAVAITTTKFYYYDTGTNLWVDTTSTLTGALNDFIQADTAFDIYIFTNNVDRVKKWTGSGAIADLGGLSTADDGAGGTVDVSTAKGITSFGGFVHVVNTVEAATRKSQRWRWSAFELAETWNNSGTYGQAGFSDITDGPDKLQTSRRLGGDFLALYKERSIHIAQYVGPPTVWSRRLVVNGHGLIAPGAVSDIVNEHVFISDDNIYIFNGLSIQAIGTQIFDQFISELNPAASQTIWAHTIYDQHEVIFAYPSGSSTSPNRAIVLNYLTGAWAFRDMPFLTMGPFRRTNSADSWDSAVGTWDEQTRRWDDTVFSANAPLHLGGDEDGYVHDYGNGYSQDGANHHSYAISPAIDTQRPDIIKRWFKVLLQMVSTGNHDLEVWYATANSPNATLTWTNYKVIPCNLTTRPWVTLDISGRYLFLRFRTNGTNNPWVITGYGHEFTTRGRY